MRHAASAIPWILAFGLLGSCTPSEPGEEAVVASEPDTATPSLPELAADEYRARVCETLSESVFDNDTGEELKLSGVDQPDAAQVTWDESGHFEVTIPDTAQDDDVVMFAYTATTTDERDAGGSAVIITVENKPLRRIRNGELHLGVVDQGAESLEVADARELLLANFDDPDTSPECGAPVFAETQMTTERGGSVALNADGSLSYAAPDELFWGTDRITFEVSDPATPETPLQDTAFISVRPRLVRDSASGLVVIQGAPADASGASLASLGTVDGATRTGDCADIGIGAPAADEAAGRVYVLRGCQSSMSDLSLADLQPESGFVISGAATDALGASLAGVGDLDGDGFDDFVVGAPGLADAPGRVYVVFGAEQARGELDLASLDLSDPDQGDVLVLEGWRGQSCEPVQGERAGRRLAALGDFDGGGAPDFAVFLELPVAMEETPARRGGVQVVLGEDLRSLAADRTCDDSASSVLLGDQDGFLVQGTEEDELLGEALAGAADLDGDGVMELVLGSRRRLLVLSATEAALGELPSASDPDLRALAHACDETPLLSIVDDLNADETPDLVFCTCDPEERCFAAFGAGFSRDLELDALDFAAKVRSGSDVSGDGIGEVILSAGNRARVLYGVAGPASSPASEFATSGDDIEPALGFLVQLSNPIDAALAPGDVDGDGFGDLLFGARAAANDAGQVYLLSGGRFSPLPEAD